MKVIFGEHVTIETENGTLTSNRENSVLVMYLANLLIKEGVRQQEYRDKNDNRVIPVVHNILDQ